MSMCPEFKDGICEIAGIEPEEIACVEISACYRNNMWEKCKAYMSQFFLDCDEKLEAVS